jgi:leader peptidase (prepilin peptidase) / N-methyltransferase
MSLMRDARGPSALRPVAAAAFAWVVGPHAELVGFVALAAAGAALAAIDVAVCRLPDRLVAPTFAVVLATFAVGAVVRADAAPLMSGLAGSLVLATCYLALAIAGGGRLGLGDVKLAGVLGLALGWFGWRVLLVGSCLAFLLSAVVTLALLATRRATLKSELPFGPFMLAAAALVVAGAA